MALFGLFEVKMKAAPGRGIVSSIVLQSDVRDEVDWEFIGGEDYRVQSNYFVSRVCNFGRPQLPLQDCELRSMAMFSWQF